MKPSKLLVLAKKLIDKLKESYDLDIKRKKKTKFKIDELKEKVKDFEKMKKIIN